LEEPRGHVGNGEIIETGADFPDIGATGAVPGGRGDDIAAIGFEIDAAPEPVFGAADVGAIGAGEEEMDAAAAGQLAGSIGERAMELFELGEGGIAAIRGSTSTTSNPDAPQAMARWARGHWVHQRAMVAGSWDASFTPVGVRGCLPGDPQ